MLPYQIRTADCKLTKYLRGRELTPLGGGAVPKSPETDGREANLRRLAVVFALYVNKAILHLCHHKTNNKQ